MRVFVTWKLCELVTVQRFTWKLTTLVLNIDAGVKQWRNLVCALWWTNCEVAFTLFSLVSVRVCESACVDIVSCGRVCPLWTEKHKPGWERSWRHFFSFSFFFVAVCLQVYLCLENCADAAVQRSMTSNLLCFLSLVTLTYLQKADVWWLIGQSDVGHAIIELGWFVCSSCLTDLTGSSPYFQNNTSAP